MDDPGPHRHTDAAALGEWLLAGYAAIRRTTAALHDAVERDEIEALDALVAERAAEVDRTQALLAGLGPNAGALPLALREQVLAELQALQRQDDHLRALLSARAQEIPEQLARLRGSRAMVAGYAVLAPLPSSLLDRRT